MAGYLNKVTLIGNLGKDPELRHMQDTKKVVQFSLATSESWKDKTTGERKEKTEWHKIVIFSEKLCDIAHNYLKKGSKVYLEGQLQTRKWIDKDNVERYTTEIVLQQYRGELTMLDNRNNADEHTGNSYVTSSNPSDKGEYPNLEELPGINDEVPF